MGTVGDRRCVTKIWMLLRLLNRWFALKRLIIPLLLLTSFTVIFQSLGVVLSESLSVWKWLQPLIYIDPVDDPSTLLVSFDAESLCNGRRLGNQLFSISALLYAARLTGRKAVLPDKTTWNCMNEFDSFFVPATGNGRDDVTVINYSGRFNETTQSTVVCPCFRFTEGLPMAYDERVDQLLPGLANDVSNRTLLLFGYFQSWRYVDPIAESVRRALAFAPEIRAAATAYLDDALPPFPPSTSSGSDGRLVRVGIHARRGDMVSLSEHVEMGYTPPGAEFYRRAIDYFVGRYARLQFVVCSDEFDWSLQNIRGPENATTLPNGGERLINVTHCPPGRSAGHDLAVLSMCDHMIVSAGTFGWWAAWLANGTTVYFNDWPRNGTMLDKMFNRRDYYPAHWIAIGE